MGNPMVFYPAQGEYPDYDTPVTAFFDGDDVGQAKVVTDGEGAPLWFRMDGEDWVICDAPICYKLNDYAE